MSSSVPQTQRLTLTRAPLSVVGALTAGFMEAAPYKCLPPEESSKQSGATSERILDLGIKAGNASERGGKQAGEKEQVAM